MCTMNDKIFAVVSGLEKNSDRGSDSLTHSLTYSLTYLLTHSGDIGSWIDLSQTEIFIVNNNEVIKRNIINESNQTYGSGKQDKLK